MGSFQNQGLYLYIANYCDSNIINALIFFGRLYYTPHISYQKKTKHLFSCNSCGIVSLSKLQLSNLSSIFPLPLLNIKMQAWQEEVERARQGQRDAELKLSSMEASV